MTLFLVSSLLLSLVMGAVCFMMIDEEPWGIVGVALAVMLCVGAVNQADANKVSKAAYAQSQQDFRQLSNKYQVKTQELTALHLEAKGKDNVIAATNKELTKTRVKLSAAMTDVTMANDKVSAMEEAVNEAQAITLDAQYRADVAEADLHDAQLIADAKVAQANSLADAYKEQATAANTKLEAIRGIL